MSNIKVGVIGVGYLGRFHAQKYSAMEGVDLVGVADTIEEQVKSVSRECDCKPYLDYTELLKEVDAVSIVVPTTFHHKVALDCIEANVDMLLEKPMTVTTEEADDIIKKAEQKKLILQIGHLERFNPSIQAMKPFITSPVFVESNRITGFRNRGVDVDVVLDLMIHDIDIILSIIDSPIKDIHAVGGSVVTDTTDIANVRMIFENGATANITCSRISNTNVRSMRVYQPGSYINVDFAQKKLCVTELLKEKTETGMYKQNEHIAEFPDTDALMSETSHFIECVKERNTPLVPGYQGRRALDIALQIIEQINANIEQSAFKNIDFSRQ